MNNVESQMSPQVAHLPPLPRCRRILFAVCLGLALLSVSSMALAQYQLTNLVSNQVGEARRVDPLLVNAWGLVHPPGGPFWISDNNSGWSTLYAPAESNRAWWWRFLPRVARTLVLPLASCSTAPRIRTSSKCKDRHRFSCLPLWMGPSADGRPSPTATMRLSRWTNRSRERCTPAWQSPTRLGRISFLPQTRRTIRSISITITSN